ncbi:glycosyltransferase family 4 protein [Burkholderia gladioli]|uniref:glycosyltransferase family 4 protein n=1 Tax=Burkholderia gladioli TaxID=28095 RepID=UPI00202F536D|nr:glycosyltransferase family 4 protein [Burkholderia gladioli]URV25519.1 glycosyltransferase family 4 protein [Burkholderia gladioli]
MKILICSNVYPPKFIGGAELIAHQQAIMLKRAGHDVEVFCGDIREGYPRHSLRTDELDGITIHRNRLTGDDFQTDLLSFNHPEIEKNFENVIARFKPDVVHGHNLIGLSTRILQIARDAKALCVVTLHDHWGYCLRNTAILDDGRICEDFTACTRCHGPLDDGRNRNIPLRLRQGHFEIVFDSVDAFISPSVNLARSYLKAGFPAEKMHVNWNGVDYQRFSSITPTPSSAVRFTFVGYFGKHKGATTLLDALALVKNRANIHVNLVGEGEQRAEYERHVANSGSEDLVTFWGKIPNEQMATVYENTDVLILPSIWPENQPVSITEAMCSAIPVIASRIGGMPELVKDGVTGLTFEPGNASDLAHCMERMASSPELRTLLGINAQETMRLNTFETQVSRLVHIYKFPSARPARHSAAARILCVGDRFNDVFAAVVEATREFLPRETRPIFTHQDWITQPQFKEFALVWVAGVEEDLSKIMRHNIDAKVPVILPKMKLKSLPNGHRLPIWFAYEDAAEALACIIEFSRMYADNRVTDFKYVD